MKNAKMAAFRAAALFAAALTGIAAFGAAPPAARAQAPAAENVQLFQENSYTAYRQAHAGAPAGTATLTLLPEQARFAGDASAVLEEVGGREALHIQKQAGQYVWTVEVPEEGLYRLAMDYYPTDGKNGEIELEVRLDGELPFDGTQRLVLPKLYRDEISDFQRDNRGNDMRPVQIVESCWMTASLSDSEGYAVDPYLFYLDKGSHTVEVTPVKQNFAIGELRLEPPEKVLSYAEYLAQHEGKVSDNSGAFYPVEAEKPYSKTSSMLYPLSDRSSPATSEVHPTQIRLNTIGGENWKSAQQTITWKIKVEKDGFYQLGFRFKQNFLRGMYVSRRIEVDGSVPFEEFKQVTFSYGINWQAGPAGGDQPYCLYLTAGEHEISMTPTLGDIAQQAEQVGYVTYQLNDLYRRIIMITSVNPDTYRDYALQEAIPGLLDELGELSGTLRSIYDVMCEKTGHKGSESASLLRMAEQLESFIREPDSIPARLSSFHNNISSLSTWTLTVGDQCLLLDSLWLAAADAQTPRADAGFLESAWFQIQSFFGSFFQDYNQIGNVYEGERTIQVWVSSGRDQAEVIKQMIDSGFTDKTGIVVNLSLVQGALLQATMAGKGPDVALQLGHGDPVNMALRGALEPLEEYEGFEELTGAFVPGAFVPYQLSGHTYALPETQNFLMMFYRTDVFEEMGLQPPVVWQDLYDAAEVLQGSNMEVGLPYVSMDAYSVVSAGVGTQSIFPTLLSQRGLNLYNENLTATALDTPEAYEVFKQWTDFYTKYGFPLFKDDYNRFRTGQMPLVIATYTFYNQLYVAAPEIRNLWKMAPIPATEREDGTLDRSVAASGTASVILSSAEDKEACWKFLQWWVGAETQSRYGNEIESVLGAAGRYNPASTEALEQMPWSGAELDMLLEQQRNLVEIPELPGGYYTSRNVDNAFRRVFFHNDNPREALNYWNRQINDEIQRKRKEYGLDGGTQP